MGFIRSSSPDEAELVARSRQQDAEAFGLLMQRHAAEILNLAARMVGDRAEAEDIVQETFLSAFKALPTFRSDARFSTWLYRIAVNKCKDWLRAKRPVEIAGNSDGDDASTPEGIEEQTPERVLSQRQVAEQLERAIQRLPPLYREAFVLKHVEGLSYEEMEDILGVNGDTLKMRVYKGRILLCRELAEWKD